MLEALFPSRETFAGLTSLARPGLADARPGLTTREIPEVKTYLKT